MQACPSMDVWPPSRESGFRRDRINLILHPLHLSRQKLVKFHHQRKKSMLVLFRDNLPAEGIQLGFLFGIHDSPRGHFSIELQCAISTGPWKRSKVHRTEVAQKCTGGGGSLLRNSLHLGHRESTVAAATRSSQRPSAGNGVSVCRAVQAEHGTCRGCRLRGKAEASHHLAIEVAAESE